MEEKNFFCDEDCLSQATIFYLDKGSKRKVCQQHAAPVTQHLYPIAGFHFISTAEDALIYLERLEKVKEGRSYLEKLKEKADEELAIALQDIDSMKTKAIQIVNEVYEVMKRRTQQLHFQIEVGLDHLNQEFSNYLKSRECDASKISTLLMTDHQLVPSMLKLRVVDNSLELVDAICSGLREIQIPLEQHLLTVLDPEQRNIEAAKLRRLAETGDQTNFIDLQIAALQCSDSINLHSTEQSLQLLGLLESKIAAGKVQRKEAITKIDTMDSAAVASLTKDYLEKTKALEVAQEWDKATKLYLKAISYIQSFSSSKETANLYSSFASFLVTLKRNVEAEYNFHLALDIQKVHFPEDIDTADTYERFGSLYEETQNHEEAETCYKSAVVIRKVKQPNNYETSRSCYKLGELYLSLKRYEEAKEVLLSALRIQKMSAFNKDNLVCILWRLGEVLSGINKYEEAVEYFKEAITNEDLNSERRARIFTCLGDTYKLSLLNSEAEQSYESALAIYQLLEPHSINNPKTLNTLGNQFARLLRFEEAESCYKIGLTALNETINNATALLLFNLGCLWSQRSMDTEAIHYYNEALSILVVHYPEDKLTSLTYLSLGLTYKKLNREREAEDCFRSVIKIEDTRSPYSSINIEAIFHLTNLSNLSETKEEDYQSLLKFLPRLENEFPTEVVTAYASLILGGSSIDEFGISDAQNYLTRTLQILENFHPNQHILLSFAYFVKAVTIHTEESLDYLLKAASIRDNFELVGDYKKDFSIPIDYPVEGEDAKPTDEMSVPLPLKTITLPNIFSPVYLYIGKMYFDLNRLREAEFYYNGAFEYAKAVGKEDDISSALVQLKDFYSQTDQMEKLRMLEH